MTDLPAVRPGANAEGVRAGRLTAVRPARIGTSPATSGSGSPSTSTEAVSPAAGRPRKPSETDTAGKPSAAAGSRAAPRGEADRGPAASDGDSSEGDASEGDGGEGTAGGLRGMGRGR